MELLQLEDLKPWNERFFSFGDAVLRSLAMEFERSTLILVVAIETQDQSSPSGWSVVTIRLSAVSSLMFCQGKTSYQVLSYGLHTLFDAGQVALEFGNFIDAPQSLSELMTSPCHVVAELLEWDAQFIP